MARNDFLVWAGGDNANVLTQANYAGLSNLTSGVVSGKASGQQANKTWRQSSIMSAMIAKFIADRTAADVVDDGTIQTIENNFIAAISSLFVIPNTGVVPGAYGPTMALTVQADGRITSLQNANLQGTGLTPGTYVAPTITVGTDGRITGIVSVAYGPLAGTNTWTAKNTYSAGVTINGLDNGGIGAGMQLRTVQGNYGAGLRNDGASVYLLQTASGQQNGVWNTFRPFSWNLSSGAVNIDQTGAGTNFAGVVSYGPSATMYINPNNAGQQLINFAANQYLQFNPARGFVLNTTGFIDLNGPAGITTAGPLSVSGTIGSNGNIVASNGRLRATFGAFGSGDGNAATLLSDFTFAGNTSAWWMRFPNGFIIQGGALVVGYDQNIVFPIAFPNNVVNLHANEANAGGGSWRSGQPTIYGFTNSNQNNSFSELIGLLFVPPNWNQIGAAAVEWVGLGF